MTGPVSNIMRIWRQKSVARISATIKTDEARERHRGH
jgi:hypothetical protein